MNYSNGQPMRGYHPTISEATGVTDFELLEEIEDCVRHDIFHSTLDWQTRDQLKAAAIEAKQIVEYVNSPEGQAEYARLTENLLPRPRLAADFSHEAGSVPQELSLRRVRRRSGHPSTRGRPHVRRVSPREAGAPREAREGRAPLQDREGRRPCRSCFGRAELAHLLPF